MQPNPYHTATHAADVLHGAYHIVEFTGLRNSYTDWDKFILYISCAIHDYSHPGLNNAFLVNSRAPLAIRYNDRSVLESYHISSAFRMMLTKEHCNIFQHLSFADFSKMRKLLIELVLSTDLAVHFDIMGVFKRKQSVLDIKNDEDRSLSLQMILKCGDLSHPSRPRKLHLKWSELVTEEFFQQGDRERALNLPHSMLMDRKTTNLAKSQIGFITFLVAPMFQEMSKFLKNDFWEKQVDQNLAMWHAIAKHQEQMGEEEEIEQKEQNKKNADANDTLSKTIQDEKQEDTLQRSDSSDTSTSSLTSNNSTSRITSRNASRPSSSQSTNTFIRKPIIQHEPSANQVGTGILLPSVARTSRPVSRNHINVNPLTVPENEEDTIQEVRRHSLSVDDRPVNSTSPSASPHGVARTRETSPLPTGTGTLAINGNTLPPVPSPHVRRASVVSNMFDKVRKLSQISSVVGEEQAIPAPVVGGGGAVIGLIEETETGTTKQATNSVSAAASSTSTAATTETSTAPAK